MMFKVDIFLRKTVHDKVKFGLVLVRETRAYRRSRFSYVRRYDQCVYGFQRWVLSTVFLLSTTTTTTLLEDVGCLSKCIVVSSLVFLLLY